MVEERGSFCSFWGGLWGSGEDGGSFYGGKGVFKFLCIVVKKIYKYDVLVDYLDYEDDGFVYFIFLFGFCRNFFSKSII